MKHTLPELPYSADALEPFMSKETLEFHHGKHHKGYVEKLNKLIKGTEFEKLSLEGIIAKANGSIFNNAAQAWNHAFFWKCLTPTKSKISGELLSAIERDFGSVEKFMGEFKDKALEVFGSGWLWLVHDDALDKLLIISTSNADTPLRSMQQPIFTCDLWEHAYYIDYRNERAKFVDAFFSISNWDFAAKNFSLLAKVAA